MQEKVVEITDKLRQVFGDHPQCELRYGNDWELLVAIILSAQCTDKRVNATTLILFAKFPMVGDIVAADITEIENIIKPCGFYHTKAKHLKETATVIMEDFSGSVPKTIAELTKLSGVGEKTASVFVSEFHNTPAIGVDTHIMRVSHRLKLSMAKTPSQTSADLQKLLPPTEWRDFHILMVLFGRYICTAKRPKCTKCPIANQCPVANHARLQRQPFDFSLAVGALSSGNEVKHLTFRWRLRCPRCIRLSIRNRFWYIALPYVVEILSKMGLTPHIVLCNRWGRWH
ncbi:MAG: endonuclease III [Christensenellaceae bacterium]|nr:endonuclease III [Christensenellaceae bacterium]